MSELSDRLRQAIIDRDREAFGVREGNQMLTHYVVIYAHTELADQPEDDGDRICRLTNPGTPVWVTLGLLDAGVTACRDQLINPEDYSP